MAVLLTLLFWFILLSHVNSQDNYDYSEIDVCSDNQDDPSLTCVRYTSCTQCRIYVENCNCDKLCHNYADCCPDVDALAATIYKPSSDTVICERRNLNGYTDRYLAVVSKCPVSSQDQCAAKGMLVYGADSGLIYSSESCAACHGESGSTPVGVSLHCHTRPQVEDHALILYKLLTIGTYPGCELNFHTLDDEGKARHHPCEPEVISTCGSGGNTQDAELCNTEPTNIVYDKSHHDQSQHKAYRNKHCAKCNGAALVTCVPINLYKTSTPLRGFDSLVDISSLNCVQAGLNGASSDCLCQAGFLFKPLEGCIKKADQDPDSSGNCTQWIVSPTWETGIGGNGSSYITIDNTTYFEYEIREGQAYVCTGVKKPGSLTDYKRPGTEPLLSVVLICLSLVCMLIHLSLYVYFKPLRNVFGLVLMSNISALFVALLVFLVALFKESEVRGTPCVVMAIIQHYAFLASFTWTSVTAFDVTRMLTNPMTSGQNKRRRFIAYSIIAWLLPLVFVVVGIVADLRGFDYKPGYGARLCWFNSAAGLLIYFLGPVFLLLLVNISLYILAIRAIIVAARQTKMVNPDMKERFYLAIKLLVVMGLPWIFAVASTFTNALVVDYIFVILNASQGILNLCCFVFSKTVLNLLRGSHFARGSQYSSNRTSTFAFSRKSRTESVGSQKTSVTTTDKSAPVTPSHKSSELSHTITTV